MIWQVRCENNGRTYGAARVEAPTRAAAMARFNAHPLFMNLAAGRATHAKSTRNQGRLSPAAYADGVMDSERRAAVKLAALELFNA